MSSDQVESYNQQGYAKGFQIYNPEEASANRKYFDALLENIANAQGTDGYSIDGYHTQCAGIWDIVTNDKIVGYVHRYTWPQLRLLGHSLFLQATPGDARVRLPGIRMPSTGDSARRTRSRFGWQSTMPIWAMGACKSYPAVTSTVCSNSKL